MRQLAPLVLAAAFTPALAQELDPGEWEFTSTSTSQLFAGPQTARFRRCIRKEDAANPDAWMGKPDPTGDCRLTPLKKAGDTYSWEMECPKAKMRGAGSARMGRGTMDGETNMTGEVQGRKFELRTKVTGRRVGPCKG